MIIARTPFRISFFGGGTDFPAFFQQHGGAVLSSTINKYCYISVHRLTAFFKHRFRASYSSTESVLKPEEFQHPLIRETLLLLNQQEGVEISAGTAPRLKSWRGRRFISNATASAMPEAGRTSMKRPMAGSAV